MTSTDEFWVDETSVLVPVVCRKCGQPNGQVADLAQDPVTLYAPPPLYGQHMMRCQSPPRTENHGETS